VFRFERESLDEIDVAEGSTVDSINVRDKVCATPASFSGVSEGRGALQPSSAPSAAVGSLP
jgi:hypothetical protein